VNNYIRIHCKG